MREAKGEERDGHRRLHARQVSLSVEAKVHDGERDDGESEREAHVPRRAAHGDQHLCHRAERARPARPPVEARLVPHRVKQRVGAIVERFEPLLVVVALGRVDKRASRVAQVRVPPQSIRPPVARKVHHLKPPGADDLDGDDRRIDERRAPLEAEPLAPRRPQRVVLVVRQQQQHRDDELQAEIFVD